jgi:hypothetical protein
MAKKTVPKTAAVEQEPSAPRWVAEMHDHFRKTGTYRVQDLQRVLGDPRDSVEVPVGIEVIPHTAGMPFNK